MLIAFALTASVLVAGTPAGPERKPTDAALRKTFEQNAQMRVEVSGGRRRGAGVIIGAGGQVATTVHHVGLHEAVVHLGDRSFPARVLSANARSKIAVVEVKLPDGETLNAPAVRVNAPLKKGMWLVGLGKGSKPLLGRVVAGMGADKRFVVTDLPLAPGSPLFDHRGRLVALVISRVGKIGSRAVPIEQVGQQLAAEPVP